MSKPKTDDSDATKRLIGALLRMPPKPHSEMKVGKSKGKEARSPEKNRPSDIAIAGLWN
jgi:hypothetical protein